MGYLRWDWNRTLYDRVRWDGSGYTLYYYYYSSLEPPSSRLFLKLYMYYVLCTCLNESFIIKKNKDKNKDKKEEEEETYINYEEVRLREGTGQVSSGRTI